MLFSELKPGDVFRFETMPETHEYTKAQGMRWYRDTTGKLTKVSWATYNTKPVVMVVPWVKRDRPR